MPTGMQLRGFDVSEAQGLPIGHASKVALTSTFVLSSADDGG
jgi:hypothetical protein